MFLGRTKIVRVYDGFGYGRREYIAKRLVLDNKDLLNQERKIYILADQRVHELWKGILKKHEIEEYSLITRQFGKVEENSILVMDIGMKFTGAFLRKFEKVYWMVNDKGSLKEWQRKC